MGCRREVRIMLFLLFAMNGVSIRFTARANRIRDIP